MASLAAGFVRTIANVATIPSISLFKLQPCVSLRDASKASLLCTSNAHNRVLSRPFASQATSSAPAPPLAAAAAAQEGVTPAPSPSGANRARVQSFDYTGLVACVLDLQKVWMPARVEECVQFAPHAVALRLRTLTEIGWLYVSWHPSTAHIGISMSSPQRGSVSEAFTFGEQVHSALKGLVLTEASVPQLWERTAKLGFAQRPGEAPSFLLHVEIMGRYSNVILSEGQGNVLAAGHQVGSKMSSLRLVQTGKPYFSPPSPPGIPPDACSTLSEWQAAVMQGRQEDKGTSGTSLVGCCVRSFLGFSPALARDLCSTAHVDSGSDPASLDPTQWEQLHESWQQWLRRVDEGNFTCTSSSTGEYSVLGSYEKQRGDSPLLFIREYYTSFDVADEFERAKQRVERGVTGGLSRLQRKIQSLQRQSTDPDVHLSTSKLADLLMAHLHLAKPGADSLVVEDWDTGESLSIPLDPMKAPVASAEVLYAKARKQRRAVDQVAPLIEEAQAQVEYLREVELLLQQLDGGNDSQDMDALKQMEAELISGGFLKPLQGAALAEKGAAKGRRAVKRGSKGKGAISNSGDSDGLRKFNTPGGLVVLVGRNSAQNDVLTTRMAQPNDVWMHARGVPGAHVLLRVPSGQAAGDEDLQFAADIAAFYSKSRTEGKAEVTLANPADISKPRGAKPGQVLVKKERVMLGRPAKSAAAAAGDA